MEYDSLHWENKVEGLSISGTLIWYYYICPREVWLMGHKITPDQDWEDVQYGRFLQEHVYARDKKTKEVAVGSSKLDLIRKVGDKLVVVEVKKSSRFLESARMQLAYYLLELEKQGIEASGELRFPEERRKEDVSLTPKVRSKLREALTEIEKLLRSPRPPTAKRIRWCSKCAYNELCWA